MLSILWLVISGLISLPIVIPILHAVFFFLLVDGAVWSPCTFFSNLFRQNHGMGIAAIKAGTSVFSTFTEGAVVGGIGQFALALNRFKEAGTVLGQRESSLTWKVRELGIASHCGALEF